MGSEISTTAGMTADVGGGVSRGGWGVDSHGCFLFMVMIIYSLYRCRSALGMKGRGMLIPTCGKMRSGSKRLGGGGGGRE